MLHGPLRLSVLAAAMAFGATGATLALVGLGIPYLAAAGGCGVAAGLVMYAALAATARPPVASAGEPRLQQELHDYRAHTAALRHDLRGVLSPALMMSDRLLNHADPGVQRAGHAVVRSIERATALLADSKGLMAPPGAAPEPSAGPGAVAQSPQSPSA